MGINIDYTPYGALYDVATRAGQAAARRDAAQRGHQMEMAKMQADLDMRNRQFTAKSQQEAAREGYEYSVKLAQAKQMIDLDAEASAYQRRRQRYMMDMERIQTDDRLNQNEKDELYTKAYGKYFGVTMGNDTMENYFTKMQAKNQLVQTLQERVDAGMDRQEARNIAAASGIPYSADMFVPQAELNAKKERQLVSEMKSIEALLDEYKPSHDFRLGPGGHAPGVYDRVKRRWIKASPQQIREFEFLQTQYNSLMQELESLQNKNSPVPSRGSLEGVTGGGFEDPAPGKELTELPIWKRGKVRKAREARRPLSEIFGE